jgi:hypothetical protein
MRAERPTLRFLMVAMMALTIAGCAGGGLGGRVVPVEPGDMAKLTGTWQGTMIFPSGASWPATLKVYPNGTYATEAGAFTSEGKGAAEKREAGLRHQLHERRHSG